MSSIAIYFYTVSSIFLTGYFLLISHALINPLIAALIIAIALHPFVKRMERSIKLPRLLSSIISVSIFLLIISVIILFFSTKIGTLDFEMNFWKDKINIVFDKAQNLIFGIFHIPFEQQTALLKESSFTFLQNSATLLNHTLSFTTHFMSSLAIFIISLFFLLYYHKFLMSFLHKVVTSHHHVKLKKILNKIQSVVQRYIFGLSLIIISVATLNTIGLMLLGIENALLFGLFSALLTIIPYIGITIGALLPMAFAFSTKNSLWYPFGVLMIFMFVQFLEGNFLTPNIVGKQVSINPLAALLGLITGGMLLGIMGVIFALPVLAVIKVICDEISSLKPIGYILGASSN